MSRACRSRRRVVLHRLGASQASGAALTARAHLTARAAAQILLFLVPSHRAAKLKWWDSGILHIVAQRADLEARRFHRTVAGVYTS